MNITMIFPTLAPHGGTRIAFNIAHGLANLGHVITFVNLSGKKSPQIWSKSSRVKIVTSVPADNNVRLLMSPHSLKYYVPNRSVVHLQMMEHLFRPDDVLWQKTCSNFYSLPCPFFTISGWNYDLLLSRYGRTKDNTFLIGNPLSLTDFDIPTICKPKSKDSYLLIEGWNCHNPTKDVDAIAIHAARLCQKMYGFKIVSYGQEEGPNRYQEWCDEWVSNPTLDQMNSLYENALFLFKASKYDARSCSPVEAMIKGTLTLRAITAGDDDIIDGFNGFRSAYDLIDYQTMCLKQCAFFQQEGYSIKMVESGFSHIRLTHETSSHWITMIEEQLARVRK